MNNISLNINCFLGQEFSFILVCNRLYQPKCGEDKISANKSLLENLLYFVDKIQTFIYLIFNCFNSDRSMNY